MMKNDRQPTQEPSRHVRRWVHSRLSSLRRRDSLGSSRSHLVSSRGGGGSTVASSGSLSELLGHDDEESATVGSSSSECIHETGTSHNHVLSMSSLISMTYTAIGVVWSMAPKDDEEEGASTIASVVTSRSNDTRRDNKALCSKRRSNKKYPRKSSGSDDSAEQFIASGKKKKNGRRRSRRGALDDNGSHPGRERVLALLGMVTFFTLFESVRDGRVTLKVTLKKGLGFVPTTSSKPPRGSNNNTSVGVTNLNIPSSLPFADRRALSINLGNGNCMWQSPAYDIPEDIDFHKTIIAGFPSGDKRMIFVQMEALTGWAAKDEWDFEFLGMSNHPFIKANYPHHEGIWGWGDVADQVVMMIRNIRRSMVEYHDILWDIGYAKTWEEATLNLDQLYSERPPIEDFLAWRDLRVIDECHWYGWFIDYWMEGGLMRDIFTHKLTTPEHWQMLMMPTVYTKAELAYDLFVTNESEVTPSYDPHCGNGKVTDGCAPKAVISAEKLRDYAEGPAETAKIAQVLHNDPRTGQYVIAPEAWDCIWDELIKKGRGLKTVYDRPGFVEEDYEFSAEMLQEMIKELTRVITKYDSPAWNTKETANRVVELLTEHRALIQTELNEVNSGVRRELSESDFLGPKERERRRLKKLQKGEFVPERKDFSSYFNAVGEKLKENKYRDMKQLAKERQLAQKNMTGGD